MITETAEVTDALRAARERWPSERERPARLLLELIREGHRTIAGERARTLADRRHAIMRAGGALTGTYPDGYLEQLRDEWPQ